MFQVDIAEEATDQTDAPLARRLTWTGNSVNDRDAEACAIEVWTERHGSPPREPYTISARQSTEPGPLTLRSAIEPPPMGHCVDGHLDSTEWLRAAVATVLSDFPEGPSLHVTVTRRQEAPGLRPWVIERVRANGTGSSGIHYNGAYRRWTVQGSGGTRYGNLAGACLLIIVVGLTVLVLRAML